MVAKIDANTAAVAQLRQDMNAQFDRLSQLMLGILGAFTALVAVTIGFALWDRRAMVRPFESKVQAIENELVRDRESLQSLPEAFRDLGKRLRHRDGERVAEVSVPRESFHSVDVATTLTLRRRELPM